MKGLDTSLKGRGRKGVGRSVAGERGEFDLNFLKDQLLHGQELRLVEQLLVCGLGDCSHNGVQFECQIDEVLVEHLSLLLGGL